jgi:hypothetical protein
MEKDLARKLAGKLYAKPGSIRTRLGRMRKAGKLDGLWQKQSVHVEYLPATGRKDVASQENVA